MTTRKTAESIDVCGVTITSSTRVVYDIDGRAVTKGDVARYVESIAPLMLPHVRGRPVTIVRAREGSNGPAFFQKHVMKGMPAAIHAMEVIDRSGPTQCLTVHDAAGLVGLVQMSALEFHVWGAKEDDCETPDRLVFDLDPAEDVTWPNVVKAARHVRALLAADDIESFVKTTGGKGLHIVAPLDVTNAKTSASWLDAHAYAEGIATAMIDDAPDSYTANMKKALRVGKIFLDFARNMRGATAIAPWSTRVRGGTVSMPVAWDELDDVRGSTFTILNAETRARRAPNDDPWRHYFDIRQRVPKR